MIDIIPAILSMNDTDFHQKMKCVEGVALWVQIDIMDGDFVSDTSIHIENIASFRHNFALEMHLMVQHPLQFLDACARIGAKRVIFHIESKDNSQEIIDRIKDLDMQVGIALNPDTPIETLDKFVSDIQSVQFMGVVPGQQGQTFLPAVIEKIQNFRARYPHMLIAVDGGVNQENIADIARAGVDRMVVGSAIVLSQNPRQAFESLHEVARNTIR